METQCYRKIKVDNAPPQFLGLQNVVADTSGGILILNWFTAQDVNGPIKYFIYVKQNDTNGIYAQVPRITLNTFDTLRDLKILQNILLQFAQQIQLAILI